MKRRGSPDRSRHGKRPKVRKVLLGYDSNGNPVYKRKRA